MIVSVSGRIGHGKDLIGKIVQAYMEFPDASKLSILRIIESGIDNPDTKIKKWADKLKDIICILLNCTREQLEDHDFKNKELGEEWWKYRIITKGHENYYVNSEEEASNICFNYPNSKRYIEVRLTPRLLLQLLGTDCGRNIIHPNIWVNSLMSEYKPAILENLHIPGYYIGRCLTCDKPFQGAKRSCTCKNCENRVEKYPNWIITDTRFPNELNAVKNRGGVTIKVVRSDVLTNSITGKSFPIKVHKKEHESETALDTATFDYTIKNNSTIEDLVEKVKQILIKEKIITDERGIKSIT